MLNRNGENRHTCLVLISEEKILFFTIKCEINCRFIIDALCKIEKASFYCQFAGRFCFYFKSGMDITVIFNACPTTVFWEQIIF